MDSWVKEYASSILNYITVVNDYIAVSLILTCLGLMTSVITPVSLITGIIPSLHFDCDFENYCIAKLEVVSELVYIIKPISCAKMLFLLWVLFILIWLLSIFNIDIFIC